MKSRLFNFWFLLILLAWIQSATPVRASGSEAYATLLYGDEFLLGVRVLGKSIRDTGSTKDMVVLVSDGVSDYAKKLLKVTDRIVRCLVTDKTQEIEDIG